MSSKRPKKIEDMSPEEIKQFIEKKRQCDSKAQSIVMELLEGPISEKTLLNCLPFINQTHYDDITIERAIINNCGYPICDQKLPTTNKVTSQTYKICTNTNKVYDITTRKNFCSNQCYKSSNAIKNQILTSPLWFRKPNDIPRFKLLPLSTSGTLGDLLDLSLTEKIPVPNKENSFTSCLQFTQDSLIEIETEQNPDIEKSEENNQSEASTSSTQSKNIVTDKKEKLVTASTIADEKSSTRERSPTDKKKLPGDHSKNMKSPKKVTMLLGEVKERASENRVDPMISAGQKLLLNRGNTASGTSKSDDNDSPGNSPAIMAIEKSIGEWFCLSTLLFLFGQSRVKEMVANKSEMIQVYLNNLTKTPYTSVTCEQYQRLCKKLNLLELEDRKYDSEVTKVEKLKPLPGYSILQEESKTLNLKVKAYYKGEMVIAKNNEPEETQFDIDEEELPKLPLIEKHSQLPLRRKIVLNGLDRVLPDLLQALDLSSREVSGEVRELIATFNLQAHNITFKTIQWNFIALVIVKLLSIRISKLQSRLDMPIAYKHLELLLMSYNLDRGYLDRLVWWLSDIDRLLKNNQFETL